MNDTTGREPRKTTRHYLNVAAMLIVMFVAGTFFGANASGLSQYFGFQSGAGTFGKVDAIYNYVRDHHVNPDAIEQTLATDNAIRGMLSAVDGGYTRYETAEEAAQFNQSAIDGEYAGIGIQSIYRPTELEVEIVFGGQPAERAGVKVRDLIIAVDGDPVKGKTQKEINSRIRGQEGTQVTLTVLREGVGEPLLLTITRAIIKIPVVDYRMEGDIGLLIHTSFTEPSPTQLRTAIEALKTRGAKAILLDLRSNPGGLLSSAEAIVDLFLPKDKVIVRQVDRNGDEQVSKTRYDAVYDGPLYVLVNEGSASASEVVSGALQDHGRATVLGVTSFGKGTVQVPYGLIDGSRVWITQYRYLTPNSRDINKIGLTPDVEIVQPDDAVSDQQLQNALQYTNSQLIGR